MVGRGKFLLGWPIFRCKLLDLGRVFFLKPSPKWCLQNKKLWSSAWFLVHQGIDMRWITVTDPVRRMSPWKGMPTVAVECLFNQFLVGEIVAIKSQYGKFTYIYHKRQLSNVCKHTIYIGSYGVCKIHQGFPSKIAFLDTGTEPSLRSLRQSFWSIFDGHSITKRMTMSSRILLLLTYLGNG